MSEIYEDQPESSPGVWNRLEWRPLEGFVLAITPFNFTAIAANLPSAPAMLGNVIVWKPAESQIYSANVIMEVFKEAGVPDGVINMVTTGGANIRDRKSTRLNSSHVRISYAVFCLKKKK